MGGLVITLICIEAANATNKPNQEIKIMSKLLKENIVVGQSLTVLDWIPKGSDNSWVGDELKVVAVQLPFVKVKDRGIFGTITLDTRRVNFMLLNDKFVNETSSK